MLGIGKMHYVYAIASIVLTGIILRSIACSTHLYREVYISAGRLACHHKYQGAFPHPVSQRNSCRVRLLLLCSSCRDGQDMVTPTVISPLFHSSPSSSSTCSPVFWTNFPCWPRKRLSNMILCITSDLHRHFGATSAVLFMETKPKYTSYLQVMSLATDLLSSTSQVIFTDTSVPPLQFSS